MSRNHSRSPGHRRLGSRSRSPKRQLNHPPPFYIRNRPVVRIRCKICNMRVERIELHLRQEHPMCGGCHRRRCVCLVCAMCGGRVANMEYHLAQMHPMCGRCGRRDCVCETCRMCSAQVPDIQEHLRVIHPKCDRCDRRQCICELCGICNQHIFGMSAHLDTTHPKCATCDHRVCRCPPAARVTYALPNGIAKAKSGDLRILKCAAHKGVTMTREEIHNCRSCKFMPVS